MAFGLLILANTELENARINNKKQYNASCFSLIAHAEIQIVRIINKKLKYAKSSRKCF
ncbi:MAG: hypothetical protein ACP5OG_02155 [Candidatus Nanoarchaeia archaeon]